MSHRDPAPGSNSNSTPAPDPAPQKLRERYTDVILHEGTHELTADAFASVRNRAQRGWGVGALLVDDGCVLLVKEDDQWFAPGGMLESGESIEEGAIREIHEETGLAVRIIGLAAIATQTFVNSDTSDAFTFHFAMFDATSETAALTDDPGLPDEDITTVEWYPSVPENTYDRDLITRLLDRQ